ncbi:hypothetical protein K501DRAFT_281516 [Backusella circina FSU 941]|nr:hypothetical protein K501DRAFT_281516 [Backusella circina FSU 941]
MVELFQKKTLQRSMKPTPLISLIRGGNNKKDKADDVRLQSLGSGVTLPISPSLVVTPNSPPTESKKTNRPERAISMPNGTSRNKENSKKKTREQRQSWMSPRDRSIPSSSTQSHLSYCQIPSTTFDTYYESNNKTYSRHSYYGGVLTRPLTPALSPTSDTRHSFYCMMKSPLTPVSFTQTAPTESYRSPSRSKKRTSTWKPAPSISSSEDDDDEVPLGKIGIIPEGIESLSLVQKKGSSSSLLSNTNDEDDDEDLVPIGNLLSSTCNSQHLSAAEKYKARVQARLNMSVVI